MNKIGDPLGVKDIYGREIHVGDSLDEVYSYDGKTNVIRMIAVGLTNSGNIRTLFLTYFNDGKQARISWLPAHKGMLSVQADCTRWQGVEPDATDIARNKYNRLSSSRDKSAFLKKFTGVAKYVDLT